jgi:hypothetical protein
MYLLNIATTIYFPYVLSGHSEIAKLLISRGVIVHNESSIMTPLELAAFRGYTVILKILLEHNADVICQIYFLLPLNISSLFSLEAVCFATFSHCSQFYYQLLSVVDV